MPRLPVPTLRIAYAGAAAVTIGVGLLVHCGVLPMPATAQDAVGDMLWAMMMVWWVSMVWPTATRGTRAGTAAVLCGAVELSQLLRWDWLVALRTHPLGHLVLGSDFDARDLLAYAAGVAVAVALEWALGRRTSR